VKIKSFDYWDKSSGLPIWIYGMFSFGIVCKDGRDLQRKSRLVKHTESLISRQKLQRNYLENSKIKCHGSIFLLSLNVVLSKCCNFNDAFIGHKIGKNEILIGIWLHLSTSNSVTHAHYSERKCT